MKHNWNFVKMKHIWIKIPPRNLKSFENESDEFIEKFYNKIYKYYKCKNCKYIKAISIKNQSYPIEYWEDYVSSPVYYGNMKKCSDVILETVMK